MSWPKTFALPYRADAAAYFEQMQGFSHPAWLDSGRPGTQTGRYDILAADPVETFRLQVGEQADALQRLREMLGERCAVDCGLPFPGGLIGFAGYELGRAWHRFPPVGGERLADDLYAGLYDWAVVVDHHRQIASLVAAGRSQATRDNWESLCERFSSPLATSAGAVDGKVTHVGLDCSRYAEAFARIQRYIREGDIYQVNFTRRFQATSSSSALDLYRKLRAISPAPFGAYLDLGDYQVLSNSPEQFLSCEAGRVQTRPIKGTRPRGGSPQEDARLRADLAASSKDRAENLMIVDLLRNDIGRVCEPGSIEVPELFVTESYATVHHLVSTVVGRLRKNCDALDLFEACFPGGSITGAPKHRAMQIIDELEPVSRELYCGSVFRLGYDGNLDSNISIRTVLRRDENLYYWAGGGIVADSECAAEYEESSDKARAFMKLFEAER